jgi:hypothetical protein
MISHAMEQSSFETLTVAQILMKCRALYETCTFISVFITDRCPGSENPNQNFIIKVFKIIFNMALPTS